VGWPRGQASGEPGGGVRPGGVVATVSAEGRRGVGGEREQEQRGRGQQHEPENLVEAAVAGWVETSLMVSWGSAGPGLRSVRVPLAAGRAPMRRTP